MSAAKRAVTHMLRPDADTHSLCGAWLGTKAKRTTERRDVTCAGCSRVIRACEDRAGVGADACGLADWCIVCRT